MLTVDVGNINGWYFFIRNSVQSLHHKNEIILHQGEFLLLKGQNLLAHKYSYFSRQAYKILPYFFIAGQNPQGKVIFTIKL